MAHIELKQNEVSEPLGDGYYIIQPVDGYRFGSDAVALKNFAGRFIKKSDRVCDLCSGCGVVGLLLAIEKGATVVGAEIDEALLDMSNRSATSNGLNNAVFYHADIKNLSELLEKIGKKSCDAVVCNPPFFKSDSKASKLAPNANSELTVNFDQIADAAKALLKSGGGFYIVHTATRLDEILSKCRSRGLTPKNLIVNNNGKTFLLRCVYGGRDGLTVDVEKF